MPGATFLCSTCTAYFDANAQRREHMRTEWHIFNMKRRIAELPSVSQHLFDTVVQSSLLQEQDSAANDRDEQADDTPIQQGNHSNFDTPEALHSLDKCLFCPEISAGLHDNLAHMSAAHCFRIPKLEQLETDLETLLMYISMVVTRFCSCVYCGTEKQSAEAIRAHMLSKGHCMLDLSPGSDFSEFWSCDFSVTGDSSALSGQVLSSSDMRLPSGAIASSRNTGRPSVKPQRRTHEQKDESVLVLQNQQEILAETPAAAPTQKSSSQALAKRDEMGLIGLSTHQQRSLAIVRHKMVAREQRHRNEARWTLEKFGNTTKQKRFKPSRSGIHSAIQVC